MADKKKTSFLKKIFKILIPLSILLLAAVAAGLFIFIAVFKDLPDPEQFSDRKIIQSTKIYDRTGLILLYEIHGEEKRTVIPYEEIPEYVKNATIAIEDKDFFKHRAFDWRSIARALIANILKGQIIQGGSTITQQLAKNTFLTPEKTLIRKIKELLVAFELEKYYSKDKILDLYLNQIPYGGNSYGIEAASQTFFKKSAKDLNLAEAALLASLPKAPSYYSPWGSHLNELLKRKDYALEQMYQLGYINEKNKEKAQKTKLEFAPRLTGIKAPHFTLVIQDYLNDKYGENFVESSGLNVITTLDWNLQKAAETIIINGAEKNTETVNGHNAALVAQDATTGQILALVGSKNYFGPPEPKNCSPGKDCFFEGNFNVAVQGLRRPGSAMKPLAYLTAFQKGYSPDSIVFDVPTEFAANNPKCPLVVDYSNDEEKCFHPQNFDKISRGPVSFRNGLAQSINIPSVKVLYLAGIDNTLKTARDFGITTLTERSRYGLSLVLGGGEITLKEMVDAYSVFAQEGIKHRQTMILKITDSQNNILEEYKDDTSQIIEPQYPRLINDILSDVKARSGLFVSSLPLTIFPEQEVALKTGTTNDYRDAWAIGYTPDLVVGVWAGNNNNASMTKGTSILAAVPMWSAFMKEILKDKSLATFNKPEPIFNKKSILKGEYIVNYKIGDKIYPQIHNILYYLDKNNPNGPSPLNPQKDSQFENWEIPVLGWAKNNVSNFEINYNQILPEGAAEEDIEIYQPKIEWLSPKNGDFVKINDSITTQANINASFVIDKIELYFNDSLVASQSGISGKIYNFQHIFIPSLLETQNSLKIKISDAFGRASESSLILFKQE